MISCEVHHNYLRVSSLRTRGNITPNKFRSYLAVMREEMILETGFIIVISFPYHTFFFGMSVAVMPVGIVVNVKFSLRIFNQTVSVVYT